MAKKAVMRQCIGCGQPRDKKSLIRIIRTTEGQIELDATGKKNGRGAYLCMSGECLERQRSLRDWNGHSKCRYRLMYMKN